MAVPPKNQYTPLPPAPTEGSGPGYRRSASRSPAGPMGGRPVDGCLVVRSSFRFAQEGDGDGGDPFAAAYGADPLVGRGLDVDPGRVQTQRLADRLPHLRQVRRQLRPLRDERGVHVLRPVGGLLHRGADLSEEAAAVGPRVGRIIRRVALADVPQAGGAEEGVDDGVEEDVGVAVAAEAGL